MPSTHVSLHYHLIFSTKDRAKIIDLTWEKRLHAFLGGTIRTANGIAECVGGSDDHVHLLLGLKATHCLADVLRDIKAASSAWAKQNVYKDFQWQEGYGAFTVSPSARSEVVSYIQHQLEHHRSKTFQEEYVEYLTKCEVDFDDQFLW
jgi:putative transposase